MELYNFAFCAAYEKKILGLAANCPEKWSFGSLADNVILKNYISHTFEKLNTDKDQDTYIVEVATGKHCLFNTGLYTQYYEEIYGLFSLNKIAGKQKWFLDGFYTLYQLGNIGIDTTILPKRANYFTDPSQLVFDTNCDIIPQYRHIFNDPDNLSRIPIAIRENPNKTSLFDGAIKRAKNMINANYKTAVPQYYKGKIQLLIPICLQSEQIPDLALVVSKNNAMQYLGHTCLTLDMAYNNARLIARPDSAWLKP